MEPQIGARNIGYGKFQITGGSALIVLGLVVLFLLQWLLEQLGAPGVNAVLQYGLGLLLVIAGIVWFFTTARKPACSKPD